MSKLLTKDYLLRALYDGVLVAMDSRSLIMPPNIPEAKPSEAPVGTACLAAQFMTIGKKSKGSSIL